MITPHQIRHLVLLSALAIAFASLSLAQDLLEPNDDTATATDASQMPYTQAGLGIHSTSDEDFFAVPVQLGATFRVELSFSHAEGDLDMELRRFDGSVEAAGTSTNDNELIRYTPLNSGAFAGYLRVYGYQGAQADYALTIIYETEVTNLDGGKTVGSLSNAIGGANFLTHTTNANVDVTFVPGLSGTITLDLIGSGFLAGKISIIGPGPDVITVSGGNVHRVFNVFSGSEVHISGLTIRDGMTSQPHADGGAISNSGHLVMRNCRITRNRTADGTIAAEEGRDGGHGAGIASEGTLVVEDCEFSFNRTGDGLDANAGYFSQAGTGGDGAGISQVGGSSLVVRRCRFFQNETGHGGNGTVSDVSTLSGGGSGGFGGAIFATNGGSLEDCVFQENRTGAGGHGGAAVSLSGNGGQGASGGWGGAVASLGELIIDRCLIVGNRTGEGGNGAPGGPSGMDGTPGTGGGAAVTMSLSNIPNARITNTTIAGNRTGLPGQPVFLLAPPAEAVASAVWWSQINEDAPDLKIVNSTVVDNESFGGGLASGAALVPQRPAVEPVHLENSIVAGNRVTLGTTSQASDVGGTVHRIGTNIVRVHPGSPTGGGSILDVDPALGPLQDSGGPSATRLPLPGSPARDGADPAAPNVPAVDQRGLSRPYGDGPDIGAAESYQLVVDVHVDENDGINNGGVSLRDALAAHQVQPLAFENGIGFHPDLIAPPPLETSPLFVTMGPLDLNGVDAIVDATPLLDVHGAPQIVLDGEDNTRLVELDAASNVSFQGIHFTGGASASNGGGFFNEGILTLEQCHVTNCRTLDGLPGGDGTAGFVHGGDGQDGPEGGAIYSEGVLQLFDCLVADNRTGSGGRGGAPHSSGGSGGLSGLSGRGGAISTSGGSFLAERTTFLRNRTGNGTDGADAIGPNEFAGLASSGGEGGAIYANGGDWHARQCRFLENQTGNGGNGGDGLDFNFGGNGGGGGAIFVNADLVTLEASFFGGNRTGSGGASGMGGFPAPGIGGHGGAAYISVADNLEFANCTLASNRCGAGLNNSHPGSGGAAYVDLFFTAIGGTIRHCTMTENRGAHGALWTADMVALENSIVAGNQEESGGAFDVGTSFDARGRNIINVTGAPPTGNVGGILDVDPELAPLGFYGGPTETRHPYPTSPAIHETRGLGVALDADQRGFPRPMGPHADLGAVETYVDGGFVDSDLDGMDDRWEPMFGFVVGIHDSNFDKDGDGKSNRLEYEDFTNPCDGNSRLKISEIKPVPGQFPWLVEITWTSWPDRVYTGYVGPDLQLWNIEPTLFSVPGAARQSTTTHQFPLQLPDHFVRIQRN